MPTKAVKLIKTFLAINLELIFWVAGLSLLAFADPLAQPHFDLCPFKALGITWCPGCGLGHSIIWLFKGDIDNSIKAHWLGIPAVLIILYRIYTLVRLRYLAFRLS